MSTLRTVRYHSSTLRFFNSGRLSSRNKWRYSLGHSSGTSTVKQMFTTI